MPVVYRPNLEAAKSHSSLLETYLQQHSTSAHSFWFSWH